MMYGLYGMYGMYGLYGHTLAWYHACPLYGRISPISSRGRCEEVCEHGDQTTMGGLRWCWGVPGSVLKAGGHCVSTSSHTYSHWPRDEIGEMRPYSGHALCHANVWAYSAYSAYITYIPYIIQQPYIPYIIHQPSPPL